MPHDIIDNRDWTLSNYIRVELPGAQAAGGGIGYFFVSRSEAVAQSRSLP